MHCRPNMTSAQIFFYDMVIGMAYIDVVAEFSNKNYYLSTSL